MFGGPLGPGGADLGPANIGAVARGVLVGPVGLGDEADVLGLEAERVGAVIAIDVVLSFPLISMRLVHGFQRPYALRSGLPLRTMTPELVPTLKVHGTLFITFPA